MKLITAQVVAGRFDVPPEIADGARVAILAPDDGAPSALSAAEEQELSEALADIQAGRHIDGWALLEEITRPRASREVPASGRSPSPVTRRRPSGN